MKLFEWISGTTGVLMKDLQVERRHKSILGTLLTFVLSTLFLVLFATNQDDLSPKTEAGLLWIVVLFTAALGLGRTFLSEEERGTSFFLRLHTLGTMVYVGKLFHSFLTLLCANIILAAVFFVLLNIEIRQPGLFIVTLCLGTFGLSGTTTILSAIIARTAHGGLLLPVLLFPLLIPLLLSAVEATHVSFTSGGWDAATGSLVTMVSFSGVVIAASLLLFDYVWES